MIDVNFQGYTARAFWEKALFATLRSGASTMIAITRADDMLAAWIGRSPKLVGGPVHGPVHGR